MNSPIIIAEFGSSPAPAWDFEAWCLMAKRAGATHVKVQLFYADHFPQSEWLQKRPLEFPRARLGEFVRTAHKYGLLAGASVFDIEAVRLAAGECDFIKLAAREQSNKDLRIGLWKLGIGKPLYRSISSPDYIPAGKGDFEITLITIPEYPAPLALSLTTVARFAWRMKRLGLPWGYSSHTTGDLDVRLAVRLGASVIEKHFAMAYTDIEAAHSLMPIKFRQMVERIK